MTWLVTGGAGYIGAHVVRALKEVGVAPLVIDDLSSGHRGFVPNDVELVRGSILSGELLADAIITVRSLIRRAWITHRWDTRPPRRR